MDNFMVHNVNIPLGPEALGWFNPNVIWDEIVVSILRILQTVAHAWRPSFEKKIHF